MFLDNRLCCRLTEGGNVGNRLTRIVTGAATGGGTTLINGTTTNAYDANDRLTTGGHSYDADGNETTVAGQTASYDFENHLVSLGSGATSYVYDADGNRVSVTSGGVATGYVVDTSLPYASVVEEYSGTTLANGTLAARYDYGDDLVPSYYANTSCLFRPGRGTEPPYSWRLPAKRG